MKAFTVAGFIETSCLGTDPRPAGIVGKTLCVTPYPHDDLNIFSRGPAGWKLLDFPADTIQALGNHIYLNPVNSEWETADLLLSSNVVIKLGIAKEAVEKRRGMYNCKEAWWR